MSKRLIAVTALLLAGCQLAPPHERPDLSTASEFPGYAGDVEIGRRPVEIGWRDYFVDPRLELIVANAL